LGRTSVWSLATNPLPPLNRAPGLIPTRLVLRPDSDFFRYFGDPSSKSPPDGVALSTAPAGSAALPASTAPRATNATK